MLTETSRRRLGATEYLALIDREVLGPDDHVELIGGELIAMPPQNPPHGSTITRIGMAFAAFADVVFTADELLG